MSDQKYLKYLKIEIKGWREIQKARGMAVKTKGKHIDNKRCL